LEGAGALAGTLGTAGSAALAAAPELIGIAALGYGIYSGIKTLDQNNKLRRQERHEKHDLEDAKAAATSSLRSTAAGIASRQTSAPTYSSGAPSKTIG
jgi:hypothetical protein